jgi:hypothetical protein
MASTLARCGDLTSARRWATRLGAFRSLTLLVIALSGCSTPPRATE